MAKAIEDFIIDFRRDLHKYPELRPPSLFNDAQLSELADKSAKKVFGEGKNISLGKYMGSEDMPYYFQHAKGVYGFIGFLNEEKGSIFFPHHERFKIDEDYLKYGTALHVQFALDYLG